MRKAGADLAETPRTWPGVEGCPFAPVPNTVLIT